MSRIYSARKAGKILGLSHLEVIRRLNRHEIRGTKLDWNWVITAEAIEEAKQADWYKRRIAYLQANGRAAVNQ